MLLYKSKKNGIKKKKDWKGIPQTKGRNGIGSWGVSRLSVFIF